jgi:hypothetical protein
VGTGTEVVEIDPKKLIHYADAVREGKEISNRLRALETDGWRLGDIANLLEQKYGDQTLARYANEIGVPYKTVLNCRTTARAWPENSLRREFSICRALNAHPRRHKLLSDNPNWSKREAEEKMADYRHKEQKRKVYTSTKAAQKLIKVFDAVLPEHGKQREVLSCIDRSQTNPQLVDAMKGVIRRVQDELDKYIESGPSTIDMKGGEIINVSRPKEKR